MRRTASFFTAACALWVGLCADSTLGQGATATGAHAAVSSSLPAVPFQAAARVRALQRNGAEVASPAGFSAASSLTGVSAATQAGRTAARVLLAKEQPSRRGRWGSRWAVEKCSGQRKKVVITYENDGSGPAVKKNVTRAEAPLVACLKKLAACDDRAAAAAQALPSIAALPALLKAAQDPRHPLPANAGSCAVVGNAGHLANYHAGAKIDEHDYVVRFNIQPVAPFAKHVGSRTSFRVVNNRRASQLCCSSARDPDTIAAGSGHNASRVGGTYMMWLPATQARVIGACKKRHPAKQVFGQTRASIEACADAVRAVRKDLARLGFVGKEWRQLTSGMRGVLLALPMCRSVSVYGFTTYGKMLAGGADHYAAAIAGKKGAKANSGLRWHDWAGESLVLRLLNAARLLRLATV